MIAILKVFLSAYFIYEYYNNLKDSNNKVSEIFKLMSSLDLITILLLIYSIYTDWEHIKNNIEDKFLWMFLSLKTLKIKQDITLLIFKTYKNSKNPDKVPKMIPLDRQLKMTILDIFLKISSLVLITTSLLLFVDEI